METTDLRKLQMEELQMANIIVNICQKYNLEYYIMGGTLLGAIRHQGFIPWDDDLDIGMKRSDYEKFMKIAEYELSAPYSIHHYKNDSSYIYPYIRIQNDSISLRRDNTKNKTVQNLWVDIFPLDGVPQGKVQRFAWEKTLYILRGLRNVSCFDELVNINKEYSGLKKLVVELAQRYNIQKFFNTNRILAKIDNYLKSWSLEDNSYIGNPMGGHWFKEVYPKEYYLKTVPVIFEGIELSAPIEYKKVLEKMYGDYMLLPKEEDRNWHGTSLIKEVKNE